MGASQLGRVSGFRVCLRMRGELPNGTMGCFVKPEHMSGQLASVGQAPPDGCMGRFVKPGRVSGRAPPRNCPSLSLRSPAMPAGR
jgi:hypothetical protein